MSVQKKITEKQKQAGRWTPQEHQRFMAAIATYGKDWKKVQEIVGTRSGSQVRSHAQKFFNKLLKTQNTKNSKQSRSNKFGIAAEHEYEESQNSFQKFSFLDDSSNITPIQIISLIKKQTASDASKKVDIKNFKSKLQQEMAIIQQQQNEEQQLDQLKRQTSFKSMNNILQAYQEIKDPNKDINQQNQSFLIGLTRHYKKYFAKGSKFQDLIDFGGQFDPEKVQNTIRKQSFTLPQGVQGTQQQVDERKKRIVCKQQTTKMTQKQKQSFANSINKKSQNSSQKVRQNQIKQVNQIYNKQKQQKIQEKDDDKQISQSYQK